MHEIVIDQFDQYLRGEASEGFHQHLRICDKCRAEVAAMAEMTSLFQDFKPEAESVTPPPGFYNRVTGQIIERQQSNFLGFLAPGSAFFRRMAFASLLVLACLGSFLVSRESLGDGPEAAAILAQHDVTVAHDESADRDRLMVTLAAYRQ